MKLSVSMPEGDVAYLDKYAQEHGLVGRSAALHAAVVALQNNGLSDEYAAAFDEWDQSADAKLWDTATGDGLSE